MNSSQAVLEDDVCDVRQVRFTVNWSAGVAMLICLVAIATVPLRHLVVELELCLS